MLSSIKEDFKLNPLDCYYTLDVNQTRLATFDTLSGGDVEINVIKHNVVYNSGESSTLLIPGTTSYTPVELKSGFGNTKELYNWFVQASSGAYSDARKNVTITLNALKDGEYIPLVAWNLFNAWPSKISGFESNQYNTANVAKFSLTIVAESIERTDP
jgi:phage tail-like protein